MHVTEPCIRAAAVLTSHWHAGNFEAVVMLLNEVDSHAEAVDLVAGMLLTRDLSIETLHLMISFPEEKAV